METDSHFSASESQNVRIFIRKCTADAYKVTADRERSNGINFTLRFLVAAAATAREKKNGEEEN